VLSARTFISIWTSLPNRVGFHLRRLFASCVLLLAMCMIPHSLARMRQTKYCTTSFVGSKLSMLHLCLSCLEDPLDIKPSDKMDISTKLKVYPCAGHMFACALFSYRSMVYDAWLSDRSGEAHA
jgi:hypothetical protein